MRGVGRGRILFWEGGSLWTMEVLPQPGVVSNTTGFHAHHAIQITLSLGGRIALRSEAQRIEGDAIVAPDAMHQFEAEGRLALVFVEPESEAGRAIAQAYLGKAALAKMPGDLIGDLTDQLRAVAWAGDKNDVALEAIGRALVARLAGGERVALLDPRIRKIIDFVTAKLDGPISLPSAARQAALSPSRARHLFVEQTGLPFRTYLLWLRIIKALGLFTEGRTLTEAAHEAGFSDSAHFSRVFRRMFGISAASLRLT